MSRPQLSVENGIKKNLPSGSRMLLAVSGGIDSMVMLHACHTVAAELKISLEVAHIDHSIRSDSSMDSDLIRNLCAKWQIPFHLKKLTPPPKGTNIEAWGRKERYSFFRSVREAQSIDWVLTAHTANDVAETVLMKLISNKELTSIGEKEEKRKLIRPLLHVSRTEIKRYSDEHKIEFREDSTNSDTSILRNKVRLKLIPFLEKEFEPRIAEILSERAGALHSDEAALRELTRENFDKLELIEGSKESRRALKSKLTSLPPALQWRAISILLKDKLGFNLSRKRCIEVAQVILGERVGVEIPGGLRLKSREGGIIFEKACD